MKYGLINLNINVSFISFTSFLLFVIQCQINDNFEYGTLENEENSILDVADYSNLYLLISSSGKIYKGIPFSSEPISTSNAGLNSSSTIAVINEHFLIAACLNDYLLAKININNGDYVQLISYSNFSDITL